MTASTTSLLDVKIDRDLEDLIEVLKATGQFVKHYDTEEEIKTFRKLARARARAAGLTGITTHSNGQRNPKSGMLVGIVLWEGHQPTDAGRKQVAEALDRVIAPIINPPKPALKIVED